MMTVSRSVRAGLAAAATLALVALAGCANAEPGVAAYVGDTKITERQVDAAVAGASTALGQQVGAPAVVSAMIHGAISERLAGENNIVITDGERDTLLATTNVAALAPWPRPGRWPTTWPTSRSWRPSWALRPTWRRWTSKR